MSLASTAVRPHASAPAAELPIAAALARPGGRLVVDPRARLSDRLARMVDDAEHADLVLVVSAARAYRENAGQTFAVVLGDRLAIGGIAASVASTAVHEAVVNAVVHGALGLQLRAAPENEAEALLQHAQAIEREIETSPAADAAIVLIAWAGSECVDILVCDDGDGFDHDSFQPVNDMHGRGIRLIRGLARETVYLDGGRTCRMRFDLPAADGPQGIEAEMPTSPGQFDTTHNRVLVVDDEPTNRTFVEHVLRGAGYREVRGAQSGGEALRIVAEWPPDLILLDMRMSGIDGIETCRRLRALAEGDTVPIVMQTAATDAATRTAAFAAGASDFVVKPLHIHELLARIGLHLQNRATIAHLEDMQGKLRRELAEARQVQQGLLPDAEAIASWERRAGVRLAAEWRCSSMLGGDIWGLCNVPGRSPGLFIADFSGHGLGAALHASVLCREIQRHWPLARSPADLLGRLNRDVTGLWSEGCFAAVTVLEIDGSAIHYATAGAPPPRCRISGQSGWQTLPARGLPVGILPGASYADRTTPFGPGSRLLVHTDGLSELRTQTGALAEDGALDDALAASAVAGPVGALRHLMRAIGANTSAALADDLTAVWLDRL